jgi:FkbM family methyltransferase
VLDIGGFWADTALYLSQKVGDTGKVYSFEFIPNNINMFNKNLSLNPNLKDRIQLVEQPISDISNRKIYYRDEGAASFISQDAFENHTGKTETITIDDFVKKQKLSKVDFIKMDIEGAELYALKGAINTIKTFKPKLGIAIYHSMDDFVSIPKWLIDLDLNYDFYLGHYTIHAEETVFFAKPK